MTTELYHSLVCRSIVFTFEQGEMPLSWASSLIVAAYRIGFVLSGYFFGFWWSFCQSSPCVSVYRFSRKVGT